MAKRIKRPQTIIGIGGVIAGLSYFLAELSSGGFAMSWPFSFWQWISIFGIVTGAGMILSGLLRNEPEKLEALKKTPLLDSDKLKVSSLMETVNALNDRMDRFMDESLYFDGDRVKHYQSLIDHPEFRKLWDKYSAQSAQIVVISPELSELVRDLLKFTQSHHRYFLKEWYMSQIPHLSKETDKHIIAIEIFRKRIQKVLEQLLDRS